MRNPSSYPYPDEPITMEEINELLDSADEHLEQEKFWDSIKSPIYKNEEN